MTRLTKSKVDVIRSVCFSHLINEAKKQKRTEVNEKMINSYLSPENKVNSLTKVFRGLVNSLQNANRMPNVIKLKRIEYSCLFNYDYKKILDYYGSSSAKLKKAAKKCIPNLEENGKLWNRFSQGVLDGARWMLQFKDFNSFKKYLKPFEENGPEGFNLLAESIGDGRIKGLRYTLANDFIKELGLRISEQLAKPDVNIKETLAGLGLCDVNSSTKSVVAKIREMAGKAGCTTFAMDKLLWLSNSGKFYQPKHNFRLWATSQVPKQRAILISEIKRGWRKESR